MQLEAGRVSWATVSSFARRGCGEGWCHLLPKALTCGSVTVPSTGHESLPGTPVLRPPRQLLPPRPGHLWLNLQVPTSPVLAASSGTAAPRNGWGRPAMGVAEVVGGPLGQHVP